MKEPGILKTLLGLLLIAMYAGKQQRIEDSKVIDTTCKRK